MKKNINLEESKSVNKATKMKRKMHIKVRMEMQRKENKRKV